MKPAFSNSTIPAGSAAFRFKVGVRRERATGRTLAIVATGAGSGHGVGLCQTGALGMPRAGKRGEEILRRYCAGVELKRLY